MARFIAPRTGADEITIAEEQEQYAPLTICLYHDSRQETDIMLARLTFTDAERASIAAGEDLFIGQMTFGNKFTPIQVTVGMAYWKVD